MGTPDRGRVVTVVGDLVLHRRQDASQTTAHQNLKAWRAQQEGREQEKREDHRGQNVRPQEQEGQQGTEVHRTGGQASEVGRRSTTPEEGTRDGSGEEEKGG